MDSTTPSGLEIRYHWEPKRKYELRYPVGAPALYPGQEYQIDWLEVPSVTTITDLSKDSGPLIWWGMTVGVAGVLELYQREILRPTEISGVGMVLATPGPVGIGVAGLVVAGQEQIVKLLKREKLTTNHVKSTAGDRGTSCHDALDLWMREGHKPDPAMFPPEERGYILGLLEFIRDLEVGGVEPLDCEVMVGSLEHGYAGRYDVRFKTNKECAVVKRVTPKRGRQYAKLAPGRFLGDLKTSKGVYPESHFRQLEAYEGASVESGYEPTDYRGIIHVHPGDPGDDKMPSEPFYEFVRSTATLEDFLCLLELHRSNLRIKGKA